MQIVLTGSLAVDQIMNFNGLFEEAIQPDKLHVLSISVLIETLRRTQGGIAGNIVYSLALLGESPILLASIGQDQRSYIESLAKMGVNTDHVHFSTLPTATFSVITDKNDCQVGGFYPGAMSDSQSLSLAQFADPDFLVVISSHDPTQMAIQINECLKHHQRLCFDVGQQVIMLPPKVLKSGLQAAEVLILNDYEMGVLCQRTHLTQAEVINQVAVCVVTLGEKGSLVYDQKNGGKATAVRAVPIAQVVDPTGAGDAFRAGFLYGYVRNWPAAVCAQLGSTVAAYVVEQYGTQAHTFSLSQVADRYQQTYKKKMPT